nr:MAG TPA: hypothetical protein [Caudoviricetes sp.]DAS22257.1 MAG TPA: hypothetical protein [Caudoviricetes sp.]
MLATSFSTTTFFNSSIIKLHLVFKFILLYPFLYKTK